MYLHLGQNTIVPMSGIIGIFDLEITSQSKITRAFLAQEEKARRVVNVSEELPRSFIVCSEPARSRTYISQLASSTLHKRVLGGGLEKSASLILGYGGNSNDAADQSVR